MTLWIFLAGIIAPAMAWIGYFYYKDRFQPEPLVHIGISYILGILFAFLGTLLYSALSSVGINLDPSLPAEGNRLSFLVYCIAGVGFIEELLKMIPFFFFVYLSKRFDEVIDGILYASLIALGFASFENMGYLACLEGFELFGRAVASPLTHTIFSSIWGYSIGLARLKNLSILKASLLGLSLASICHGLFDFFTLSPTLRLLSALLILMVWIWRLRIIEKLNRS